MEEFEGSPFVLVADVDCTAGGESKCQEAAHGHMERRDKRTGRNEAGSVRIHEDRIRYDGIWNYVIVSICSYYMMTHEESKTIEKHNDVIL